jgi:hypothetical protein
LYDFVQFYQFVRFRTSENNHAFLAGAAARNRQALARTIASLKELQRHSPPPCSSSTATPSSGWRALRHPPARQLRSRRKSLQRLPCSIAGPDEPDVAIAAESIAPSPIPLLPQGFKPLPRESLPAPSKTLIISRLQKTYPSTKTPFHPKYY